MSIADRITAREAPVTIFGLGYVGLPLAVATAEAGYQVYAVDKDPRVLDALEQGSSHVEGVPPAIFMRMRAEGKLTLVRLQSYSAISYNQAGTHVFVVCVPTPITREREPNAEYIELAAGTIKEMLLRNHVEQCLIIVESTTYPTLTESILNRALEEIRTTRIYRAYSPERIDPAGSDDLRSIPKVLGSDSDEGANAAEAFYATLMQALPASGHTRMLVRCKTLAAAEAVKVLENSIRFFSISYANAVAIAATESAQDDAWQALSMARTRLGKLQPHLARVGDATGEEPGQPTTKKLGQCLEAVPLTARRSLCPDPACPALKWLDSNRRPAEGFRWAHLNVNVQKPEICFPCGLALFLEDMCHYLRENGIDAAEVFRGIASKPFDLEMGAPGPGIGGHCIPVDPLYLLHHARLADVPLRMIEHCDRMNCRLLPDRLMAFAQRAMLASGADPAECPVVIVGVAYKPNVPDIRESPGLRLAARVLRDRPYLQNVFYHDPVYQKQRERLHITEPLLVEDRIALEPMSQSELVARLSDESPVCLLLACGHAELESGEVGAAAKKCKAAVLVDYVNLTSRWKAAEQHHAYVWGRGRTHQPQGFPESPDTHDWGRTGDV